MDKVEDIAAAEYVPSNQDILHCRRETTDLQKVEFSVDIPPSNGGGVQRFLMYDIGGQREHRHKMVYVFADIQVLSPVNLHFRLERSSNFSKTGKTWKKVFASFQNQISTRTFPLE